MRIKKTSNHNEYFQTKDGIWVRNFCLPNRPIEDINKMVSEKEVGLLINNETDNFKKRYADIQIEIDIRNSIKKAVIVSDGFDFSNKSKLLNDLGEDVCIVAVNKALKKWEIKRSIDYYVINNPYPESLACLPKNNFPKCFASLRTNPLFLDAYKGMIFTYRPANEKYYSGISKATNVKIDDYRNPICAAIGILYKFGVQQLLLLCTDDAFASERSGAEKLESNLWTYPQHLISNRIIDADLYWLSKKEIKTGYCSNGPKLKHAAYINEEDVKGFFI